MPTHLRGLNGAYIFEVDKIYILQSELFNTELDFILIHELAHSTAHPMRLNRARYSFVDYQFSSMEEYNKDKLLSVEGHYSECFINNTIKHYNEQLLAGYELKTDIKEKIPYLTEELLANLVARKIFRYLKKPIPEYLQERITLFYTALRGKIDLRILIKEMLLCYNYLMPNL